MKNKIKFAIQLYRQSQDLSAICRKKKLQEQVGQAQFAK